MEVPLSQCGTLAAGTCSGEKLLDDSSSIDSHRVTDCAEQYSLPFQILKEAQDCQTVPGNLINAVSYQTHE